MAAITKETNTLNINLIDAANSVMTWKLDNPKDNVTLAEVNTAIADLWYDVGSGKKMSNLVNSAGNEIIALKSVEREKVIKEVEQITA